MKIKYLCLSSLFFAIGGCHSPSSRTQPEPVSEIPLPGNPTAAVPLSTKTRWIIQPTSEIHNYRSVAVAVLEAGIAGSSVRDSVSSIADFSLSLTRETRGVAYSATVEAFRVSGGSKISGSSSDLRLPFSFSGHIGQGHITTDLPTGSASSSIDCSSQTSSSISIIQRLLIITPVAMQKGMTWTDSTAATVCSGLIPVLQTVVRSYRVIGETQSGDVPAILLQRDDRVASAGEGSEGQHRVQLKSQATGKSSILIDALTGSLIDAAGTNTSIVSVTVSGRTQQFIQSSREHVTRR
jgi:hypothetical protein